MRALFVRKNFSQKEWGFYAKNPIYCSLGFEGYGMNRLVRGAFLTAAQDNQSDLDACPKDCYLLSDEELRQLDNYYRANNIFPRPLD